jgi:hypothetical protein
MAGILFYLPVISPTGNFLIKKNRIMRFRNCIPVVLATFLFASCGQNYSKKETTADSLVNDTSGHTAMGPSANVPDNTSVNMDVPEATRTAFAGKYPNATNVNWNMYEPYDEIDWTWTGWPTLDTSDYVVTYSDNGAEYRSFYDDKNNWVGTIYPVSDEKGVPAKVKDVLDKSYSGYTVVSIHQENDKNRTAYEIKMENGADNAKLLIDENGKVLKKVTNTNGVKTKEKSME